MEGREEGLKERGVWGSFLTQKEVVRSFLTAQTAQSRGKRERWEVVRELNQGFTNRETRKGGVDVFWIVLLSSWLDIWGCFLGWQGILAFVRGG